MTLSKISRIIDHIVYAVKDLDEAMDIFEDKLGVRPIFGGHHPGEGTKNALVNLNQGCYLEFIAVDESNKLVTAPRWMGIDLLTRPKITRWAIKSNDLKADSLITKVHHADMGNIYSGSRSTANGSLLEWTLIKPLSAPEVEIIPFMLDWSKSALHPSMMLPEMGCELVELSGTHPTPEVYKVIFDQLDLNFTVNQTPDIGLKAIIKCPNGLVEI